MGFAPAGDGKDLASREHLGPCRLGQLHFFCSSLSDTIVWKQKVKEIEVEFTDLTWDLAVRLLSS